MASANLIVLMGNLTRSPELRYTPGGQAVTTLNLAVNRRYKDRNTGEWVENVDFIPVSVWGVQAENCEKYLKKGRGVYIEGKISQKRWETPDGEKRSKLEVVARNVQFLSSGSGTSAVKTIQEKEEIVEEIVEKEIKGLEAEKETGDDNEEIPF